MGSRDTGGPNRQAPIMEPLEPRILLSSDLEFTMSALTHDVTLRLREVDGIETIELVDTAAGLVLQRRATGETSWVTITGSQQDDALRIEADGVALLVSFPVLFDGRGGHDTVSGPRVDVDWYVEGEGGGRLGVNVFFTGVENLSGAADNEDTFYFLPEGRLAGVVDGGAGGFDTVVPLGGHFQRVEYRPTGPDSGSIARDDNVITFAGMEPVKADDLMASEIVFNGTLIADQVTLKLGSDGKLVLESDNDLSKFESFSFDVPSTSLTINLGFNAEGTDEHVYVEELKDFEADLIINGEGGPDQVIFKGDVNFLGHSLTVDAETIEVQSGVTLDATQVSGIAGDITLKASDADQVSSNLPIDVIPFSDELSITVKDATIKGGMIALEVLKESLLYSPFRLFGYRNKVVSVDVSGSTIEGTDVSITATAKDRSRADDVPSWVNNYVIDPLSSVFFDGILPAIPLAVMVRGAEASVTLNNTSIVSSGGVTLGATTVVDASVAAMASKDVVTNPTSTAMKLYEKICYFSAGYSQADGSAVTSLYGTTNIQAAGDVSLTSDATTTSVVAARTTENIDAGEAPTTKAVSAVVSVFRSNTTSHALVGEDVTITAGGNVNVHAKANVEAQAKSGVSLYQDGLGGLGVAIGWEKSDVKAEVNGHVTASGWSSDRQVNLSQVHVDQDTVTIPDHGFEDGQEVVYLAEDPNDTANPKTELTPISGLLHNETYKVVVIDKDTIQLKRTSSLDLDASAVNPDATHTLSRRTTVLFDPQTTVDPGTDTITIAGHGFLTGQPVDYAVGSNDQNPLGGLPDQGPYYVIRIDADRFRLARTEAEATATTHTWIDLTDRGEGSKHVLGFEETPVSFVPADAVDTPGETIALPDHAFSDGDALVYRTDPTIASTQTAVRWSTFIPSGTTVTFEPTAAGGESGCVVDPATDSITFDPSHSFVTGQKVRYSVDTGAPIGGLLKDTDYFIIKLSDETIQLASSREHALAGQPVNLTGTGTGDSHTFSTVAVEPDEDLIFSPNHKFETGQELTYFVGAGDPVGGLTSGGKYYAIRVDDNFLKLASSRTGASAGAAINLTSTGTGEMQGFQTTVFVHTFDAGRTVPVVDFDADRIELPGHGLADGDKITYRTSGGDPIGGLSNATDYYVIVVDADHVQLAADADSVLTKTAIPLSAGATIGLGLHALEPEADDKPLVLFDPTEIPPVDVDADTIRVRGHGFADGEQVVYLTGGGTPIGGLTDGQEYWVIVVDDDTIQLAASEGGDVIELSPGATGSSHGLERTSTVTAGDAPIGGLLSGEIYFVTVVDKDTIRLAESYQEALAAKPVQLDPAVATGTAHTLTTQGASGIAVVAELEASNLVNTGTLVGETPTISDMLTKGELQSPGWNALQPKSFKSADFSLQKWIVTAGKEDPFKESGSKPNETGSVAGGFGLNMVTHDVVARVGGSAVLKSGMDVEVRAEASQKVQVTVEGNSIAPKDGKKKFAISAAVGLGFYDNEVLATIDDGAVVDASDELKVLSSLTYPLLVQPIELVPLQGFWADPDDGSLITEVATTLDGKLGLTRIMNLWAATKARAPQSKLTVTGSVAYANFANRSEAVIGSGALINQDPDYQTAGQFVAVKASTEMQLVNIAGIIHIDLNERGVQRAIRDKSAGKVFSLFGNQAETLGIGGSAIIQYIDNDTIARIEEGAMVRTGADGGLIVDAHEDIFSFELAQAGGDSGKVGISGSLSLLEQTSDTVAHLESGGTATGREGSTPPPTTPRSISPSWAPSNWPRRRVSVSAWGSTTSSAGRRRSSGPSDSR